MKRILLGVCLLFAVATVAPAFDEITGNNQSDIVDALQKAVNDIRTNANLNTSASFTAGTETVQTNETVYGHSRLNALSVTGGMDATYFTGAVNCVSTFGITNVLTVESNVVVKKNMTITGSNTVTAGSYMNGGFTSTTGSLQNLTVTNLLTLSRPTVACGTNPVVTYTAPNGYNTNAWFILVTGPGGTNMAIPAYPVY